MDVLQSLWYGFSVGLEPMNLFACFLGVLMGTLVLPMLSAFPVYVLGWKVPTNASDVTALTGSSTDILHFAVFLVNTRFIFRFTP